MVDMLPAGQCETDRPESTNIRQSLLHRSSRTSTRDTATNSSTEWTEQVVAAGMTLHDRGCVSEFVDESPSGFCRTPPE
jgi:hypothetical protein